MNPDQIPVTLTVDGKTYVGQLVRVPPPTQVRVSSDEPLLSIRAAVEADAERDRRAKALNQTLQKITATLKDPESLPGAHKTSQTAYTRFVALVKKDVEAMFRKPNDSFLKATSRLSRLLGRNPRYVYQIVHGYARPTFQMMETILRTLHVNENTRRWYKGALRDYLKHETRQAQGTI